MILRRTAALAAALILPTALAACSDDPEDPGGSVPVVPVGSLPMDTMPMDSMPLAPVTVPAP